MLLRRPLVPIPSALPNRTLHLFILLTLLAATSTAQRFVPFDRDGKVLAVTREMERDHAIIGRAGLLEARILQVEDSVWTLEMTIEDSIGVRRESRTLSAFDLAALRDRFAIRMGSQGGAQASAPAVQTPPDQEEGRDMFVQSFTGLGIAWYGWTFPAIIGVDAGGSSAVGLYLLTAGGSYFVAKGIAEKRSISLPGAAAFQYFATRGIVAGFAVNTIIFGKETEARVGVPIATVTSLVAGFNAMRSVTDRGWGLGRVRALGSFVDAGGLAGLGTAFLLGDEGTSLFTDAENDPRRYAISILAGGIAGLGIGQLVTGSNAYSDGDADVQDVAGYLGAGVGFTVGDLAGATRPRPLTTAALSGMVVGHVVGALMARGADLTRSQGRSMQLVTSGGIIVGLGLAELIGESNGDRSLYLSLGALGGTAAFLLSYESARRSSPSVGSMDVSVDPSGLTVPVYRDPSTGLAVNRPLIRFTVAF